MPRVLFQPRSGILERSAQKNVLPTGKQRQIVSARKNGRSRQQQQQHGATLHNKQLDPRQWRRVVAHHASSFSSPSPLHLVHVQRRELHRDEEGQPPPVSHRVLGGQAKAVDPGPAALERHDLPLHRVVQADALHQLTVEPGAAHLAAAEERRRREEVAAAI